MLISWSKSARAVSPPPQLPPESETQRQGHPGAEFFCGFPGLVVESTRSLCRTSYTEELPGQAQVATNDDLVLFQELIGHAAQ